MFRQRFNFIFAADGGVAQSEVASTVPATGLQLSQLNIKAPRNGYVYVYVSNRSDQNVYFDNFKVTVQTGNIIEENHYYSYGLKIAAISSRKLPDANEGTIKNNNLYNDKELWDDGDLNWYDYGFRNYDPQIGRFPQLDPLTDAYGFFSPYLYGGNDPIANIDFMGLGPETGFATGIGANLIGDATTIGSTAFLAGLKAVSATTATVSAVSKGFSTFSLIANVSSILINTSILASNLLNTNVTTTGVGPGPASRGSADALLYSTTFGLLGRDHSDEYDDPVDKKEYLYGRVAGDAAAAAIGANEIKLGGGVAGGSGGTLALFGLGVVGHGLSVIAYSSKDVIWVTQKLNELTAQTALSDGIVKYSTPSSKDLKSTPNNTNTSKYVRDYQTKNTKQWSAYYGSEREARAIARQKLGKNPVEVEPGKWRSANGKWQFRAKPLDVIDKHIHLEELNPQTGEVIQNLHLRWK